MTGKLADAIHLHLYAHERVPRHRRSTIALLFAVTGAGLGLPAYALSGQEDPDGQVDPPAAMQAEARQDQIRSLDTVSVTVSRAARRLGGTAPTPTTVVGAEELSDTNVSVVADHLNRLPAFRGVTTPATTSHSSQNAGANFLNLRGLSNNRTLVLVNGYRHGSPANAAAHDILGRRYTVGVNFAF